MIKLIKVLVDYGQSFEYEHNGSQGERITCWEAGFKFSNREGELTLEFEGEYGKVKESDKGWVYMANQVERIIQEQVNSF